MSGMMVLNVRLGWEDVTEYILIKEIHPVSVVQLWTAGALGKGVLG